ncbi:hypothetical protein DES39_1433 [Orbus hercynius]|uniref:Divergent polysaccharide deacetylase n=1 Tax=Orbus hercynius TaxID=593135 RepID=A0A495RFH1_9GAMM|nr:divergent polysaccharide deacetylase family protein [Orbus hercynius]RKS86014.1 hypothetical protein DES39_1433 [Orbus hercynius]
MKQLILFVRVILVFLMIIPLADAAKLALVIDDFGYREHNEEQLILMPYPITIAVLPHSPNAAHMATLAHQNDKDVIIHLPMAPMGKQPLEIDTLFPSMSELEIKRIIDESVEKVPYAIGVNNHMGSLMTSDLAGMRKVMSSLSPYSLFFLDSRTIARSQAIIAAQEYRVAYATRNVFLDDSQDEQSIAHQLDIAIRFAQKHGSAIAIGHPYNATVKVLKEKLIQLPDDIELVNVSSLVLAPEKITLGDLAEQYKREIEQKVFDYMLLKQTNKKPD